MFFSLGCIYFTVHLPTFCSKDTWCSRRALFTWQQVQKHNSTEKNTHEVSIKWEPRRRFQLKRTECEHTVPLKHHGQHACMNPVCECCWSDLSPPLLTGSHCWAEEGKEPAHVDKRYDGAEERVQRTFECRSWSLDKSAESFSRITQWISLYMYIAILLLLLRFAFF